MVLEGCPSHRHRIDRGHRSRASNAASTSN